MEVTLNVTERIVVIIRPDTDPDNPRNWDNVGTMACEYRRYTLGDKNGTSLLVEAIRSSKHFAPDADDDIDDDDISFICEYLPKCEDILALPLYLYDHGDITMSTSRFTCPWDSGQVGFIFCTLEHALSEWGPDEAVAREKALSYMEGEVTTYDQFLTGDVYGFEIERQFVDEEGKVVAYLTEHLDSCWGFYGSDVKTNGILDHLDPAYHEAALAADITYH